MVVNALLLLMLSATCNAVFETDPLFFRPELPADIELGDKDKNSTVLTSIDIDVASVFLKKAAVNIRYPSRDDSAETIKYISVRGKVGGGYARILSGGVNQKHVTIRLSSRWSKPMSFSILIKGDTGSKPQGYTTPKTTTKGIISTQESKTSDGGSSSQNGMTTDGYSSISSSGNSSPTSPSSMVP